MTNCEQLIAKIKSGEVGVREALEWMFADTGFKKSAKYWYGRYPKLGSVVEEEDVFMEAIIRFISSVFSAKREGYPIKDCKKFFHFICRNVVSELYRKLLEGSLPEDNETDKLILALLPYLDKLSRQCRLLLYLIYYHQPPYDSKDVENLAEILEAEGFSLAPENIPATISRCKKKLKELIDREGFDPDPDA